MKRPTLTIAFATLAAPAFAHYGSAHEHEQLGMLAHVVVTALPVVVAVGLIGLLAYAYSRRKA